MATPLDVSALKQFGGVFSFLFVLVLVYAILSQTAWFKEKQGMAALIALTAAFMTLFSTIAMKTINMMAPWFVLFVIFVILFILVFMIFGYSQKDVTEFVTSGEFGVGMWVMAVMIIIGVGSLVAVVNEEVGFKALTEGNVSVAGEELPASQEYGFWQTVFHPKILGMVLILLISYFAVRQISKVE
ncbi:hypothetical protein KY309_02410 [Candidatus Woesearchaeota archaeon]|nr:hypothetical protein [Candidatus Woesearchaeota archaeon]MBW3016439.1 hypothetical protein [Candidatus Woesearchaeota archaeon]